MPRILATTFLESFNDLLERIEEAKIIFRELAGEEALDLLEILIETKHSQKV